MKMSLLNSYFKVSTGIEAHHQENFTSRTISPLHYAAGNIKRISHSIDMTMFAVFAVSRSKEGLT